MQLFIRDLMQLRLADVVHHLDLFQHDHYTGHFFCDSWP